MISIKDVVGIVNERDDRQELVTQMVRQWSAPQILEYLRTALAARAEGHFLRAAAMPVDEAGAAARSNLLCYARGYDQAAKEIEATLDKIKDILG